MCRYWRTFYRCFHWPVEFIPCSTPGSVICSLVTESHFGYISTAKYRGDYCKVCLEHSEEIRQKQKKVEQNREKERDKRMKLIANGQDPNDKKLETEQMRELKRWRTRETQNTGTLKSRPNRIWTKAVKRKERKQRRKELGLDKEKPYDGPMPPVDPEWRHLDPEECIDLTVKYNLPYFEAIVKWAENMRPSRLMCHDDPEFDVLKERASRKMDDQTLQEVVFEGNGMLDACGVVWIRHYIWPWMRSFRAREFDYAEWRPEDQVATWHHAEHYEISMPDVPFVPFEEFCTINGLNKWD